jgi:hypothetical protein
VEKLVSQNLVYKFSVSHRYAEVCLQEPGSKGGGRNCKVGLYKLNIVVDP